MVAACDNFKIVGEYIKKKKHVWSVDRESTHSIALGVKLFDIKYLVNKRWVARMCAAKVIPTLRVVFMFLKLIFIAFSFYLPGLGKATVGLCEQKSPCTYS